MSRTPNDDTADPLFTSDPEVMGGRLVFRGTRIPVEILFDNLADGMSLVMTPSLRLKWLATSSPRLVRSDILRAQQNETIRLSPEAQRKFAELLLNPPEPPDGLKRAFAHHRRSIREIR